MMTVTYKTHRHVSKGLPFWTHTSNSLQAGELSCPRAPSSDGFLPPLLLSCLFLETVFLCIALAILELAL